MGDVTMLRPKTVGEVASEQAARQGACRHEQVREVHVLGPEDRTRRFCADCGATLPDAPRPRSLFMDNLSSAAPGEFLASVTGRARYRILRARPSRTKPNRALLVVERIAPEDVPEGATVHGFVWYRRRGKR